MRISLLTILILIISSCSFKRYDTEIELDKLKDTSQNYGIVVLKSSFFGNEELGSRNLSKYNKLSVYANFPQKEESFIYDPHDAYKIGGEDFLKPMDEKFIILPEVREPKYKPAILKREAFYRVTMLPAGEYEITYMNTWIPSELESYGKNFDKNEKYKFTVEQHKINYIGDFYIILDKKKSYDTYSTINVVLNNSNEAKNFINEYYKEIKLPYKVNLIHN